ncbi:MAG: tetratricopeptide repeat protein [Myxococcaceae bacterium]|nr:tetratricopeptide repeat protein [Myxococcaceae bacterium]
MATRARGEKAAVDDEFLHNLYKGGELLAAGKVIEAKDYLEKAFKLQPKNEKGQNLLGLTYFKLGLFDRAAEIYEALVRDNPVDATLRVNLGLVYLKTNQLQRAIREFETAVDLAPDHKKAHNYLGLALAQVGNYAEAKEHFIQAGSEAMALKMERAMAGEATGLHRIPAPLEQQRSQKFAEIEGSEVVAERGGQQVTEVSPPRPAPAAPAPEAKPRKIDESWGAQFGEEPESAASAPPPEEEMRLAEDEGPPALNSPRGQTASFPSGPVEEVVIEESGTVMTPEDLGAKAQAFAERAPVEHAPAALAEVPPAPPEQWEAAPLGAMKPETALGLPIAELAPTLEVLHGAVAAPFEVRPEGVAIAVDGELLTRLENLLFVSGAVRFEPELKRFRGRTTDQGFGEGDARMTRAKGRGVMLVAAPKQQRFVTVDLSDESAYFREEVVFAFEEAVMFENGRVPSEATGDLDLVHLRGKGKVLLRLDGNLRARQVRMDEPVTVPRARLVGWFGNLTPRLVTLAQEEGGRLVNGGAELSGEGWVLFSLP